MDLKHLTIALMMALAYEILLKAGHMLLPSLFTMGPVSGVTSVLSFIVGVIILLFLYFFYREEKRNRAVGMMLTILAGCLVLHVMLRIPFTRIVFDHTVIRFAGHILNFIQAVVLVTLLLSFRRSIASAEKQLIQATVLLAAVFGIGTIKSLFSLIEFARFVISGTTVEHAPMFYNTVLILFIITHGSIMYFLYRYYQFKFTAK